MKVYLAAPIFNPEQLNVVELIKGALEELGYEVFSPYHNSRAIWRGRKPADCTPEERGRVLTDNIENIDDCDVLLAWVGGMGGFTDPGVVWEMGYTKALQRLSDIHLPFTLAYIHDSDGRQDMNLMLAGTIDSVAKGSRELREALELLASTKDFAVIRDQYDPDRHLAQEKEPIV